MNADVDVSPEEYGAYWQAAIRIGVGILVLVFGHRFASPFFEYEALGARVLGFVLFSGLVFAGSVAITMGLARVVRIAVRAERR